MANRYNWVGDLAVLTTEAEALGTHGRESVQRMFEHLYFGGN